MLRIGRVVDELFGVAAVHQVLDFEEDLTADVLADLEALRAADIEGDEGRDSDRVPRAEDRLIDIGGRVVIGAEHGSARIAGRIADAEAGLEALAKIEGSKRREVMRLIVIKAAPVEPRRVLSLGARERIAQPSKEGSDLLNAKERLAAIASADGVLSERLGEEGLLGDAPPDELIRIGIKAVQLEVQLLHQAEVRAKEIMR